VLIVFGFASLPFFVVVAAPNPPHVTATPKVTQQLTRHKEQTKKQRSQASP
jgi:hypothetical protein